MDSCSPFSRGQVSAGMTPVKQGFTGAGIKRNGSDKSDHYKGLKTVN